MNVNARVLKRFVIYMAILTFVMFTVWGFVRSFMDRPPGDYETEVCDIRLKDKKYAQALYESSKDSKELLENIQHEIEHVAYLYKKESAFRLVFNSMRITNDKKRNIIKGTLKQFSPIITEFLSIVIEHNQSNQLLNIISRFN